MSCKKGWQRFVNALFGRTCISSSQVDGAARCIQCHLPLNKAGDCPDGHSQEGRASDPRIIEAALRSVLIITAPARSQAGYALLQAEVLLNEEGADAGRGSTTRALAAAVVQQMTARRDLCRDKAFRGAVSSAAAHLGQTMATTLARIERPAYPLLNEAYNVGRLLQAVGRQIKDKRLFAQGYVLLSQARRRDTVRLLPLEDTDLYPPPPLRADLALGRDAGVDLYEKYQAAQVKLSPIQVGLALAHRTRWLGQVAADESANIQLRAEAAEALAADLLRRYPTPAAAPLVQPWLDRAYVLAMSADNIPVQAAVEEDLRQFYHLQGNRERELHATVCGHFYAGQSAFQYEHWETALQEFGKASTALQEAYREGFLARPTAPADDAARDSQQWDARFRQMTAAVHHMGAAVEGIPTEGDANSIRECDLTFHVAQTHAALKQFREAHSLYRTAWEQARSLGDTDMAADIEATMSTLPPAEPPTDWELRALSPASRRSRGTKPG